MQINPKPSLSEIGGKAYQLYRLEQSHSVPAFFVLSFDEADEIDDPIVQGAISEYAQAQNFALMAVRSSANCEDSEDASFAGLFETVLNVTHEGLVPAVRKVLASVQGQRVADYCQALGLDQSKIRMAVIVQEMMRSRVSGVCLTRMEEKRDLLVIESCYGLGEALVSGKVSPDTYSLDRCTLSEMMVSVGYQKVMLSPTVDGPGKAAYKPVPFHKRNARKLTPDETRAVATTCLSVERRLGYVAADVEWTFEGDTLHILQARPYSAFGKFGGGPLARGLGFSSGQGDFIP